MLDGITSERNRRIVFRLSRVSLHDYEFLTDLNLDVEGRQELLNLLSGRIPLEPLDELLDGPFRPNKKLRKKTRYSDGSFPVFYSAMEAETAEAEMAYWFRKDYVGKPRSNRTAYYQGFRCTFEGLEKDLRSKTMDWPDLVHESDYSFCNQLGAEAREWVIDGLVVPSARHEGENMPIFARRAVSGPELEGTVAMTYSSDTGEVSIDRRPQE